MQFWDGQIHTLTQDNHIRHTLQVQKEIEKLHQNQKVAVTSYEARKF